MCASWDAGKVLPYLFVGSLSSANDEHALKEHGITHVLTVGRRLSLSWNQRRQQQQQLENGELAKSSNVIVHTILVDDHPAENLLPYFQECYDFIQNSISTSRHGEDQDHGKVLVHCASGISRSAAVCCAFLMMKHKMSYDSALKKVRADRPLAKPNFGFERQLQCLESRQFCIHQALEKWKELEVKQSSTESVRQSREQANELHFEVDRSEEAIMSQSEAQLVQRQDQMILELSMLQNRIDNILTDQVRESVGDRPTKVILQSASSKANRLLGKLYSLDDNKHNPYHSK